RRTRRCGRAPDPRDGGLSFALLSGARAGPRRGRSTSREERAGSRGEASFARADGAQALVGRRFDLLPFRIEARREAASRAVGLVLDEVDQRPELLLRK